MHILYAVTTCSNKVYQQLFSQVKNKPAYHTQKYHRLLIEGLAAHAQVDVIANPPVNRSVLDKAFAHLPAEEEGGAKYHYIPAIRSPILKLAAVGLGTFFGILCRGRKDSVVVIDCLNRVTSLAALAAAKVRGLRCVGIVTDLPELLSGNPTATKLSNFVIRHVSHYVLLTEAMNDYLKNTTRPYVVLEGHADITMAEKTPSMEAKLSPRVCMYAGCVSKHYGLGELIDGFRSAKIPNVQLHLYGPCDFEEELRAISAEDPSVYYGGMLLNTEIVDKEMEATLLVNPRPTDMEYVKYSFPSKTMEYMSTGTPVLTTRLPGMPKEYYPHVYFIDDESADGIAAALKEVMSNPDEALFEKGCAGRDFVLNCRNNVVQAKKIIEMLDK